MPIWARPALLLRRIHPAVAGSVRADLELLARLHPQLPNVLPLVALALVAAEALGKDSGSIIGPVFVNRAGVVAVFAVAWLAFRRQEL